MPLAVALLLLLVIGGSLAALFGTAPPDLGAIAADGYLRHVLLFTTIQALLSALLSVGLRCRSPARWHAARISPAAPCCCGSSACPW